jgi:hypothetical protein
MPYQAPCLWIFCLPLNIGAHNCFRVGKKRAYANNNFIPYTHSTFCGTLKVSKEMMWICFSYGAWHGNYFTLFYKLFCVFCIDTLNKISILYPWSHLSWNGLHVFWKKIKGYMFYSFDIFLLMFITYYFQFQLNLVLFPTSQCDILVHVLYLFLFLLPHYILNWLKYLHSIKCKIKNSYSYKL